MGAASPAVPVSVLEARSGIGDRTAHKRAGEAALDDGADCRSSGGSKCRALEKHGGFNWVCDCMVRYFGGCNLEELPKLQPEAFKNPPTTKKNMYHV